MEMAILNHPCSMSLCVWMIFGQLFLRVLQDLHNFKMPRAQSSYNLFFHFIGVHLSARDYCTQDSWGEFKIYNILLLKSPSLSLPPSRKFRQHHACIRVKRSCMWPSQGHQFRGGRLTSLDVRCFVYTMFCFLSNIVKNIEVNVFKTLHR